MKSNDKQYAICFIRNNRLLVQEENGNQCYVLPGGTAKKEEGAIQALCREIKEGLGVELDIATLSYLGQYEDGVEANNTECTRVEVYQGGFNGQIKTCPRIKKIIWFGKDDDQNQLAPLLRNKIIPALQQKGLLT